MPVTTELTDNVMRQTSDDCEQDSEQIFFDRISDEAIERTADMWGNRAFTLGNCTGLESCPA
jgi:hypothetical protein